jgi:hypothetical protein
MILPLQGIVKYAKNNITVLLAERTTAAAAQNSKRQRTYKKTLHA